MRQKALHEYPACFESAIRLANETILAVPTNNPHKLRAQFYGYRSALRESVKDFNYDEWLSDGYGTALLLAEGIKFVLLPSYLILSTHGRFHISDLISRGYLDASLC